MCVVKGRRRALKDVKGYQMATKRGLIVCISDFLNNLLDIPVQ
jgi:hypothetical protein